MKIYSEFDHLAPGPWSWHELHAGLRHALRDVEVDWYQVAVVAVTTFAISMDLMFPPVRVAIGRGLDVYAGHAFMPPVASATVQVDFPWLAVELLLIVAAAVIGWQIGTPKRGGRKSVRDPV